jgi:hypothetical protein
MVCVVVEVADTPPRFAKPEAAVVPPVPPLITGTSRESTYAVVATLVELFPDGCVVAVVPLGRAVLTFHVPDETCATPVELDVSSAVPPAEAGTEASPAIAVPAPV